MAGAGAAMELTQDEPLERSSVVANCAMNRERGLTGSNGYNRELGVDVLGELRQLLSQGKEQVRWRRPKDGNR